MDRAGTARQACIAFQYRAPLPIPQALSPWLRVPDHPLDRRETSAQAALDPVYQIVNRSDCARRIDIAVKIHDLAIGGITHPHIVDITQDSICSRKLRKRGFNRRD